MGCNCCRMLNSYMFKPQELPTNGYVNEAHNYEHDRTMSPTIKISELMNEGYNIIERDRFTGSHNFYNASEKINAKDDEADSTGQASFSSYAVSNENFIGDVKEQDGHVSQSNDNLHSTPTSSHQNLETPEGHTTNSDEPECIQHELSGSMQENISLTESAILEVKNSNLNLESYNDIGNTTQFNGLLKEENVEQYPNIDLQDNADCGSCPPLDDHDLIQRSRPPSLVDVMIERNIARGSKKGIIAIDEEVLEDDMDPDVAEALAALAAAIAGEDYEDY
ncbi:uncharacterized protein C4orf19 homolog [Hyla sarda]|uniref:uncharacterized protein C4orf19 homolog n=1 Tax=Hyla sarda TaxID=327740 RepID=UPI0024C35251|nr:uncharacterized protein C4orf19 homolog [Hyla sarda]XP_056412359.1 uncharacterized protein C4orf19 homolog [Hyla sarda]XP_056412369.1 uncharacterized protein C4orf19 homolog [Hyla sarda]XP_056412377.1 uncharacterized protein C4orf19 homolog [Hyla sarda]XP_056412384.1 uncharacterized protein C4orf19 homolog [Hyla sarda]XP_056412392.1 uncharacterized protein C4orf19 homolog [Hyla sarda]